MSSQIPALKDFTLEDFLLPYQKTFANSPQKKKLALFGRQLGKSFDLAYIAVKSVLTSGKAKPLSLCISTGARASSEFLKKVVQMAEAVHIIDPSITYSCSADKVEFSTGARIISLPSGNPAALRGWSVNGAIIIDEAAYIDNPNQVFAAIAPTLTRDPDALLVVASTPAGKASWFYNLYEEALQDESWYVQTTTIEDAAKQGLQVDIDQLKKTINDPDVWTREYMCEFAAEYSSLVDISLLKFSDEIPQSCKHRFCGVDIGATGDRTAIVDIMQLNDGTYFVDDIVVLHKAEYQHQLEVLRQLFQKYSWTSGYLDANGIGNPIAEFANKQVSARLKGFTWTGTNKPKAYENLRSLVFDYKIVFAEHLKPLVVQDFQNVHRVVNEAGVIKYEAGRDANGHSDATSAIVLGLMAAKEMPGNTQQPVSSPFPSAFGNFINRSGFTRRI